MKFSGIILAAGASSRMGRPKALLAIGGETFAGRLMRVLATRCATVVIVLGYQHESIRASLPAGVRVAINPDPARGQLSSLQCGLTALDADTDAVLFLPVDCPAVEESTVARLCDAIDADSLLAIPRYESKRGHPVAVRSALIAEFLALPPEGQAREVVHRYITTTAYVDVNDPGILGDIDDPIAYQRLLAERQPAERQPAEPRPLGSGA